MLRYATAVEALKPDYQSVVEKITPMKMLRSKGYGSGPVGRAIVLGLMVSVLAGCVTPDTNGASGTMNGDAPALEPGVETNTEASTDAGSGLEMPNIRLPRLGRSVVTIESLMADSADKSVAIQGTVVQRVAILDGWLYQMKDETGELWVLADHADPEVGQRATVEGTVRYEAIVVGEIDAGEVYLEAKSYRRERE